jgi:hypothetical protein
LEFPFSLLWAGLCRLHFASFSHAECRLSPGTAGKLGFVRRRRAVREVAGTGVKNFRMRGIK